MANAFPQRGHQGGPSSALTDLQLMKAESTEKVFWITGDT
jgi:hypothetical protein